MSFWCFFGSHQLSPWDNNTDNVVSSCFEKSSLSGTLTAMFTAGWFGGTRITTINATIKCKKCGQVNKYHGKTTTGSHITMPPSDWKPGFAK